MKKQFKMHVYKDQKISYMPGSITNGHVTSTSIDIPHVYDFRSEGALVPGKSPKKKVGFLIFKVGVLRFDDLTI